MRRLIVLGVVLALSLGARGQAAAPSVAEAAKAGDVRTVRALVRQHADVNAPEADGMTALHWAVRNDDLETVRLLVAAGAHVTAGNRYGITPLILAAQNGDPAIVELLLQAGADPNAALPSGQTALMTAARTGSAAVIRALAAHGADVNAHETWMGEDALMWAAGENHADAVKALAELGANLDARSTVLAFPEFKWSTSGMVSTALPRGGWTALMYAARQGSRAAADALADAHANLDVQDPDGTTALVIAIINAHYDLAAMLLDKGADPNVADATGTAALYALVDMHTLAPMQGRPAPKLVDAIDADVLLQKLIAHGAHLDARLQRPMLGRYHGSGDATLGEGTTPFLRAAKAVDLPFMKALLAAGADPTLTKKDRTNAVMLVAAGLANAGYVGSGPGAAQAATIDALQLLVDHGVDVNAFNTAGQTAMHIAAGRGLDGVVKFLAEHGARVDVVDKQGRTPLDVALGKTPRGTTAAAHESTAALLRQLRAGRTAPKAALQ